MVWNSLPVELRDPACGSDSFKQFLKTILFSLYYNVTSALEVFKCYTLYKSTIYLHTYFLHMSSRMSLLILKVHSVTRLTTEAYSSPCRDETTVVKYT